MRSAWIALVCLTCMLGGCLPATSGARHLASCEITPCHVERLVEEALCDRLDPIVDTCEPTTWNVLRSAVAEVVRLSTIAPVDSGLVRVGISDIARGDLGAFAARFVRLVALKPGE